MSSFAMAGRGPRARYYAGVNSLSIFSAQGSNPLQDCKVFGKGVTKVYDKSVKGCVYSIHGGLHNKLQLPKDDSKTGLQLLHHFLVLQVFVPPNVHFSVELRVSDNNNTRRKMYFSTSFSDIKSTPLHCQIPISTVIRNKWLSLAFHVADLYNSCFRGGVNFRSIDVIVLGPVCKLRKIFTMRCRITETGPTTGYFEEGSEDCLPQEHQFASGVDACVQTLDMASVQSAVLSSNEAQAEQDSRPGVAPESGLTARKGGAQQGKVESNRSVHVAFGTRMPLPLSTVQINTNLPHDKSPTLVKDRIGKVHFVSDPTAAAAAAAAEGDSCKPPSNMITRALSVASLDREVQQRRKADGWDSKAILKSHRLGQAAAAAAAGCPAQSCSEERGKLTVSTEHVIGNAEPGLAEEGSGDSLIIPAASAPDPVRSDSPKIRTRDQDVNTCTVAEGPAGRVLDSTVVNKSPSKWVPRKREVQMSTHLKQQRKDQRSKEYKQSRYVDSPPGSPPCGWDITRCTGGNQTEDINFHDHFLEGSWMNSQLSTESMDAGKPYCLANSLKEKILSSKPCCFPTRLEADHEEEGMVVDHALIHKYESKLIRDTHLRESMSLLYDDIEQTEWGISLEGPKSFSTGSSSVFTTEMGADHDQDHNYCKDSEAISTYGDYYSEGQQSWSSGSASVLGDVSREVPCFLSRGTTDAAADHEKLGGGAQYPKSDLQSGLPTPLLAKESEPKSHHEDDELMFDIHDDRFFPGHPSEKKKDVTGLSLDTHSMAEDIFANVHANGVGGSFDFGSEPDICEDQGSSPHEIPVNMSTSTDFSTFTLGPVRSVVEREPLLKSWRVPEADQHPSGTFSSRPEQKLADQELQKGPVKSNVRPDEDLDLLYDPTLDCYYDPKTNRYYELK